MSFTLAPSSKGEGSSHEAGCQCPHIALKFLVALPADIPAPPALPSTLAAPAADTSSAPADGTASVHGRTRKRLASTDPSPDADESDLNFDKDDFSVNFAGL